MRERLEPRRQVPAAGDPCGRVVPGAALPWRLRCRPGQCFGWTDPDSRGRRGFGLGPREGWDSQGAVSLGRGRREASRKPRWRLTEGGREAGVWLPRPRSKPPPPEASPPLKGADWLSSLPTQRPFTAVFRPSLKGKGMSSRTPPSRLLIQSACSLMRTGLRARLGIPDPLHPILTTFLSCVRHTRD